MVIIAIVVFIAAFLVGMVFLRGMIGGLALGFIALFLYIGVITVGVDFAPIMDVLWPF